METKVKSIVLKILDENRALLEEGKLTKRQVRRMAEERLQMEPRSLDDYKDAVSDAVTEFLEENAEEESSPEPVSNKKRGRPENLDDKSPKKKAKVEKAPAEKKKSVPIKFYSDVDPPKFVKKVQKSLMSGATFEATAEDFELDVHGNIVTLVARTFTSGNRGWWGGGKMPVLVGEKRLWAQMSCNITVLGSKEWDDE